MAAISPDILRQVKRIELRTRGLVNSRFVGEYHSVFKGQGMEFSEVREYQPGDEVRAIDWNVSARMRRLFQMVDVVCVVRHNSKLERGDFARAAVEGNFFLRGFNYLMIGKKVEDAPAQRGAKAS